MPTIRAAEPSDEETIRAILEAVVRDGQTHALPREMSRADAIAYWFASSNEVFVAASEGHSLGPTICAQTVRVAVRALSAADMTANVASGKGVASAMCSHFLDRATKRGFGAMQFNSSSEREGGSPLAAFRFRKLPVGGQALLCTRLRGIR